MVCEYQICRTYYFFGSDFGTPFLLESCGRLSLARPLPPWCLPPVSICCLLRPILAKESPPGSRMCTDELAPNECLRGHWTDGGVFGYCIPSHLGAGCFHGRQTTGPDSVQEVELSSTCPAVLTMNDRKRIYRATSQDPHFNTAWILDLCFLSIPD